MLVDRQAELGPGGDGGGASRSVEHLHEARHQFVLRLVVTQTAVASEPPGEHSVLLIQSQLSTKITILTHLK